jgi:hypothetical protein
LDVLGRGEMERVHRVSGAGRVAELCWHWRLKENVSLLTEGRIVPVVVWEWRGKDGD